MDSLQEKCVNYFNYQVIEESFVGTFPVKASVLLRHILYNEIPGDVADSTTVKKSHERCCYITVDPEKRRSHN
jgi:hypothetical protein